jgi:cytochrome c-type biogenesis protein
MAEPASIGLALAFSAGLLSFLSPCVLPLIPSYLTFVTGVGLDDLGTARRSALVHALLFVLGFTLIFVALGASATVLGRLLGAYRIWITRVGGALVVLFGLYLLGVVRVAAFDRERRVHLANKPVGYLGTALVGVAFGAGWTPCLGPILGAILTYTAASADLATGLPLLLAYSFGLALPFLLAAGGSGAVPRRGDADPAVPGARVADQWNHPDRRRRDDDAGLLHDDRHLAASGDAGGDSEQAVGAGAGCGMR